MPRHIDDSKSENILRARELVKRLGSISYDELRNEDVIELEDLREIVVEYCNLLYDRQLYSRDLSSDRVYYIAENLLAESRKIVDNKTRTKEEFDVAIKIEMLKSAEGERKQNLINWIDDKIQEYEIAEDSPVIENYNNALGISEKWAEKRRREQEGLQRENEQGIVACRNRPNGVDDLYSEEHRKQLEEKQKEIEKIHEQGRLEKKAFFDEKHNQAKQRAEDAGKFWPELVDYVFWRLRDVDFLEASLNVGFPMRTDTGYETQVSYALGFNKSFNDSFLEETQKEFSAPEKAELRKKTAELGRESLESVLGTEVFLSGESLSILFHK